MSVAAITATLLLSLILFDTQGIGVIQLIYADQINIIRLFYTCGHILLLAS